MVVNRLCDTNFDRMGSVYLLKRTILDLWTAVQQLPALRCIPAADGTRQQTGCRYKGSNELANAGQANAGARNSLYRLLWTTSRHDLEVLLFARLLCQ